MALAVTALAAQTGPAEWDVTQARGKIRTIDFTTDEGTWMSVDISPDGRWILFDLLGHVYRVASTGGQAENLTESSGVALNLQPRYSPDGARIAFVSDRTGPYALWVMGADGSDPRPVFVDPVTRITEPSWSSDGQAIFAVRNFPTYSMHRRSARIWRFALDGGATELVGVPWGTQAYWPSASPDGRHLYYMHSTFAEPLHGRQRTQHIRRYDLATGAIGAVTTPETDRWYWSEGSIEMAPELSPDGKWLAFARRIPGAGMSFRGHTLNRRTALWLREIATGAERILMDPITFDMAEAHGMKNLRILPGYAWAKDSRSLVLSQGGKLRRVFVADGKVETIPFAARVRRSASEAARSTVNIGDEPFSVRMMQWPSSTPDGRTVVFGAVGQVWTAALPDGPPKRLTQGDGPGYELMPVVSPDGQSVAWVTWEDGAGGHLWKAPIGGGRAERLTTEPGEYTAPVWSADGRSLLVVQGGGATRRGEGIADNLEFRLVKVPTTGGAAVQVQAAVSPSGVSVGANGRLWHLERRGGAGDIQIPLSQGRPIPESYVLLVSTAEDGKDRREHLRVPTAEAMAPSPDGKWVAIQDELDIYLAPLQAGAASYVAPLQWSATTPRLDSTSIRRLSRRGGVQPRWRSPTVLEFLSGNRYFAYDVARQRLDTIQIDLRITRPIPTGKIALTNARLVTLDQRRVIERGTVIVEGSRIRCVGRCSTAGARVVDLAGKTMVPGFVDVHAHHLGGGMVHAQHRSESALYLAYGVTTVLDPSAAPVLASSVAELIEAGRMVGPRTFHAGDPMMPVSGSQGPASYEEMADYVNRLADWGAISIKFYLAPTRQQRQWVAEAARRRGLSVTNEGADLPYNLSCILDGHTGWEHPMMYVPTFGDVAKFFGQAGAVYSPTLAVAGAGYWSEEYFQSRGDLWNDPKQRRFVPWSRLVRSINASERPLEEYSFPMMAEAVADIVRAGGKAAVGGHGEQIGLDSHWEMWVYGSALSPMETLEIASLGGAYMAGLEDDLGSITVGKLADLVVLNSNPLENIRRTTDIRYVIKGGVLYDGNTLDEIWPTVRPYGPSPWARPDVYRSDVRPVDYWDRRK